MKHIFILSSIALLVGISCSEKPATKSTSGVPVTHKEMASEVVKTVANMTIGGMHCADGCGGKIQQELQALEGVIKTELDYAEDREANVVKVEFDPTKTDEQKLIGCVNAIMDGEYPVKSVEVINYKGLQGGVSSSPQADVASNDFGRIFQLLNLLQTVTKLAE